MVELLKKIVPGIEKLVSVVIPVYNHETFVVAALRSVMSQNYRNIEVVVIDDCSQDSSYKIVQEFLSLPLFSTRFNRVVVRQNHRNYGAHATLNAGITECRGDFITFLNSDDVFMPERISRLVDECQNEQLAAGFSAVIPITEQGDFAEMNGFAKSITEDAMIASITMPSISFGFLGKQLTSSTGNIFASRLLIEKIGEFGELKYCHDWDYMMRIITLVEPKFIPEYLYGYRIHGSNSFSSLANVAVQETAAVMGHYFSLISSGRCYNDKAPTQKNWPLLFEHYAAKFGTLQYWLKSEGWLPPNVRTRDQTISSRLNFENQYI